jgi:serine phosphatase RsbU (regulator of sigma subunit)/Flp pilus assembly protein TadD
MFTKSCFYFLLIVCINTFSLYSEEQDSLSLFKNLKEASTLQQKVKANIGLGKYFLQKNTPKCLEFTSMAVKLSEDGGYKEGKADAFCVEGEALFIQGNYDEANLRFTEALSIYKKLKNNIGIAESYEGLGKLAYKNGENDAALTHFSEALKLFEKEKYKNALPGLYINIGLLYDEVNNFKQALDFYNKALLLAKEINDEVAEASCYTNIGGIYTSQGKYALAITYFETSLKLKEKAGNIKGMALTLNNLGAVYYELTDLNKALENFQKAYDIYIRLNDVKNIFPACNNIGTINLEQGNYDKALIYFNKAYDIAKAKESVSSKILCLENLTLLHKQLGNTSKALDYCMECSSLKDTLFNKEQTSITAEMQTRFATEKKQQENELLNLQVKSESFVKTIFIIAACLLLVIAFFIFRGLRQKQKINSALEEKNKIIEEQKQTVEHQKYVVEEQNKDITDSIRYAERIQSAILPPEKQWYSVFPQSFVFYKPKDILSGDFYWIEQKGDLVFVAAADCTGHGVPGALISIVNYNLLNKAVLEKDLNDPADILNYVNHQLILSLHQTYQESSVKDGMDISLCVLNTKTLEMHFAGANNPIYVIKNKELTQVNADKFPVGAFIEDQIQSFTTKKMQLQKNDLLYLFSDGYADQFGGDKGKKFKYKQLKDVLLDNQNLPLQEQYSVLENRFTTWKGKLEQVDDVLVIGIRV